VIGASGFLGSRLVEKLYLEQPLEVRAGIHRPATAARLARYPIKFVDCDLLDKAQVSKALNGCDMVVNCAADSTGDKRKVLDVLVKGTSNLLQAAAEQNIRKLVHISSAAVQGFGNSGKMCEESSPIFSRDPYVRGKTKSEKIVMAHAQSISVVILRPTLIYGPYSSDWTISIIERLKDDVPTIIGDRRLANLVYVDDVADAIIRALLRDEANGQTFIINNPQSTVTWAEYVQKYAEELGISPRRSPEYNLTIKRISNFARLLGDSIRETRLLLKSPEFLALLTSVPILVKLGTMLIKGEKRKDMENTLSSELKIPKPNPKILRKYENVNKQFYNVLTCRTIFSSKKAESLLGFSPQVSFSEGIRATLEWARWAGYL
jgi:nucleoside-diphosphate-sugar epimerase